MNQYTSKEVVFYKAENGMICKKRYENNARPIDKIMQLDQDGRCLKGVVNNGKKSVFNI